MARRLVRWGLWLTIALSLAAPIRAAEPQRIIAVGDLHGDYQAWRTIARAAGLIDAEGRWAGGRITFVQTGDIVDRGPDSLKIIEDLMRLQREARRAGGQVVVLTGNHEAMMVIGDLRYVHPGEYRAFVTSRSESVRNAAYETGRKAIEAATFAKDPSVSPAAIRTAWMRQVPLGMIEHQQAWSPNGRLGRWTIANPAAVRIGRTLFVHGGISQDYAALPLDEINRRVSDALKARDVGETSIINDARGPLWYRGLIMRNGAEERPSTPQSQPASRIGPPPRPSISQEVDRILAAYKVRRIVVGHTPNLTGIAIRHGGRLVQIDTGIAQSYGGVLSWLEIAGDRLTTHSVPRASAGQGGR